MSDIRNFPNGYEVVVLNKHDILQCIDDNVLDKDIALAVVEQCELDAAEFISQGRWTGLPYIGNVCIPKTRQLSRSEEQVELVEQAKEVLDKDKYILFRKSLNTDNIKKAKYERYYNYITSIAVNKNRSLFKKLCATKGELYAKFYIYALYNLKPVNYESVNVEDNEDEITD